MANRFDLKRITKTLYDIQDIRRRIEGRLGLKNWRHLKSGNKWDQKKGFEYIGEIDPAVKHSLNILLEQLADTEFSLCKQQKKMIDDFFPFGQILIEYPGIDYKLAGVLLSEIDIVEASTVSKLWRYSGLDPTAKAKKGEKHKYNKFLKTKILGTFGHMAATHFNHPLRPFYDARKMRREAQKWGESKGHRHNDAVRYAVKMWESAWLYPTWRAFEGLFVRPPYQEEYLNKKHNEAMVIEETMCPERAIRKEKTKMGKRVTGLEKTTDPKRAIKAIESIE
jgi:hypothetical protein